MSLTLSPPSVRTPGRPRTARPQRRSAGAIIDASGGRLASAALAAGHQSTAHAQTVEIRTLKQTAERQSTVNRFIYSQSPQAIPSSYDSVREAEEVLRQQQSTLPASDPQARSLWAQIGRHREISAFDPCAGARHDRPGRRFEVGRKIGSGINAKFLKLGLPEAIPHTNTDFRGNGSGQYFVWHTAGSKPRAAARSSSPWTASHGRGPLPAAATSTGRPARRNLCAT